MYKTKIKELENAKIVFSLERKERLKSKPRIYEHFKGKFYVTLGISSPIVNEKELCKLKKDDNIRLIPINIKHTETEKDIRIFIINNKIYHLKNECKDELVLYKSIYLDNKLFLRPIDIFLSEVDKNKYPEVSQRYRFKEFKLKSELIICKDMNGKELKENDIVKALCGDEEYLGIVRIGRYGSMINGYHVGIYIEWLGNPYIRTDIGFFDGKCEIMGTLE
ncbi:DUF1653 domain-containing protein [Clostridioides difficile]|uniref:DUF1653 domain-containing protein n=1 Tax=Clostridioides difficile TaxID=1496 RepID=UPI001033B272|nr:DUF1653 domain-containing protein [Clostridioides difficile]MDM9944107.1 DUF1653 domain-containing protein [Clostridioides difficile]